MGRVKGCAVRYMTPLQTRSTISHIPLTKEELSIGHGQGLFGMKSLGLLIFAALLLILVVGEASSAPVENTLNAAMIRNSDRCHRFCYWNPRRGMCWYIRGEGNGVGACQ